MGTPFFPISTKTGECQDCYKCVRNCPVKAITVKDGQARINPDECILCGKCFSSCPAGAKQIRDDLARAKQLMRLKKEIIVSLAPSYITEFPGIRPETMVAAIKKLGFSAVSETALGAQEVSASVADLINKKDAPRILISSACPVVVQYINKYFSQYSKYVTHVHSPVIAHAKLLKRDKPDAAIVFISPCIAKKWEADNYKDLLDIAITFDDLRQWFSDAGIDPYSIESDKGDSFYPEVAEEGSLYPVDGGMIAGIKANCPVDDLNFMAISGLDNVIDALKEIEELPKDQTFVIELLACEGGCVNGPVAEGKSGTVLKRHQVFSSVKYDKANVPRKPGLDISVEHKIAEVKRRNFSEDEIRKVLRSLGKLTKKDELNCGGCGYSTCKELAEAILRGNAEPDMCVSYMKKQAQRKAKSLLEAMPSSAVIVDKDMKIVESNKRFAEFFGLSDQFEIVPGLEGADFKKIFSASNVFEKVLQTSENIYAKKIKVDDKVLLSSVFVIEEHNLVGGIFQDITNPVVRREEIIQNAQDVLQKNLTTVQKIASLLGESAAETEVTLKSIIKSFDLDGITDMDDDK